MKLRTFLIVLTLFSTFIMAYEPHFMEDPAISPDGNLISFIYDDDVWTVPFEGGEAKRLTSTYSREYSPIFSPDGKWIAYGSNKSGQNNIYLIPVNGGKAEMICDQNLMIVDWYPDGKSILTVGSVTIDRSGLFRWKLNKNPQEMKIQRPELVSEMGDFFSTLSSDQKRIVFPRRGDAYREKYKGSKNGELWEYDIETGKYTQLTFTETTERYPVFSHTKNSLYYGGSDGENFQLVRVDNNNFKKPVFLTKFKQWAVRDLSIARSNDRIVFEKFDELWVYNPDNNKTQKVKIEIFEDTYDESIAVADMYNTFEHFDVSPDGKFIAFSCKYDLFAIPANGGEVRQLTFDQPGIENVLVLNDNKTILFSKHVKGQPELFQTNINTPGESKAVSWGKGRYINSLFLDENQNVVIRHSKGEKRYMTTVFDSTGMNKKFDIPGDLNWGGFDLTKDEKFIAYSRVHPQNYAYDIVMRDIENEKDYVIMTKNKYVGGYVFSPDLSCLFYTYEGDIHRLDFEPKSDFYLEKDNWDAILKEDGDDKKDKKAKKDAEKDNNTDLAGILKSIDRFDIRETRIVNPVGRNYILHVIDDTTFYYTNENGPKTTIRKANFDGGNDDVVKEFNGKVENVYTPDGNTLYFKKGNKLYTMSLRSKHPEMLKNHVKYEYNKKELNKKVFEQVWAEFGLGFYDKDMHGYDWNKAYKVFSNEMEKAQSVGDLQKVVNEMIGDVNASHTGFYPRKEKNYRYISNAYLGLEFDYSDYPKKGMKVAKAYKTGIMNKNFGIKKGDILLSVDGKEITAKQPLNKLLFEKKDKKIELVFLRGKEKIAAEMKGLSWTQQRNIKYDSWVLEREEIVDKLSKGKLGYLHIKQMNDSSYKKFIKDLYSENFFKDGLIIDIRGNGGGNIHNQLIDALTKKSYAMSTTAKRNEYYKTPRDAYEKPLVLLIDQDSFSDAEIFPQLFRYLEMGTIVGMPTSGSVIGTVPFNLFDGSSMRMPKSGWFTMDGVNMEGNGAQPHVKIDMTPKQIINDDDVQLEKAVSELLKQI